MGHIEEKITLNYILNKGYDGSLFASETRGCNIKINGKWLLDTSMGCGTFILGHGFTNDAVKKAIDKGSLYACPNVLAEECGKLLHKTTWFNHFIFANSGMEAIAKSIRVARAYTGRDKVAFFLGGWHGGLDYGLVSYSKGIPQTIKYLTIALPFNSTAFEILEREKPAIVIIEPVQSSCPIDRREFLAELREFTTAHNIVLCFDEVKTGFRMSLGGGGEYLGITPDLACYGKIVGGGYPVGVIAGDDVLLTENVKYGGTFSANPITLTACIETLKALVDYPPYIELRNSLHILSRIKSDIIQIMNFGCIGRLVFTTRKIKNSNERDEFELPKKEQDKLISKLRKMGVYVANNKSILLSTLHTEEKVNFIKQCLESL